MKKRLISLLSVGILPTMVCPIVITSCSQKQEFEFVGITKYATATNSIEIDSEFISEPIPKSTATYKKFKYVGEFTFEPELYTVEVQQQNNDFVNLTASIHVPEDPEEEGYEEGEFDIIVETSGFEDVNVPAGAYPLNLIIRSASDQKILFNQDGFTFQIEEQLMNSYKESGESLFPKISRYEEGEDTKQHAKVEYDGFVWFHKPEGATMPTIKNPAFHTLPQGWTLDQQSWEFVPSQDGWGTNSIVFDLNTGSSTIPWHTPMDPITFDYEITNDEGISLKETDAKLAIPFYSETLALQVPEASIGTFQVVDREKRVAYIDIRYVKWNHPTGTWSVDDIECDLVSPSVGINPLPQLHDWIFTIEPEKDEGHEDELWIKFEILTDEASDTLDETAIYDIGIAFKTPKLSPTEYTMYDLKIEPFAP